MPAVAGKAALTSPAATQPPDNCLLHFFLFCASTVQSLTMAKAKAAAAAAAPSSKKQKKAVQKAVQAETKKKVQDRSHALHRQCRGVQQCPHLAFITQAPVKAAVEESDDSSEEEDSEDESPKDQVSAPTDAHAVSLTPLAKLRRQHCIPKSRILTVCFLGACRMSRVQRRLQPALMTPARCATVRPAFVARLLSQRLPTATESYSISNRTGSKAPASLCGCSKLHMVLLVQQPEPPMFIPSCPSVVRCSASAAPCHPTARQSLGMLLCCQLCCWLHGGGVAWYTLLSQYMIGSCGACIAAAERRL